MNIYKITLLRFISKASTWRPRTWRNLARLLESRTSVFDVTRQRRSPDLRLRRRRIRRINDEIVKSLRLLRPAIFQGVAVKLWDIGVFQRRRCIVILNLDTSVVQ
ncbi:hypothetical protein JOB18_030205 [Solea senegalensis]|uniref:Uncharacterized protein n=1 Tax=Solea senegalensis TaxID=28829 RepID=A0AAV6R172_SOLSE|nr:hypothetical protein JOB18_030205 [Solea senegalensis]